MKCVNCKRDHKADLKLSEPFCCRKPQLNKKMRGITAMNSKGMMNKEWINSSYLITTL